MNILLYSIATISLLCLIGYLIFKLLREKADKSFSTSQQEISTIENLKVTTIKLIDDVAELIVVDYSVQAKELLTKKSLIENIPFNKIQKDTKTKESIENLKHHLLESKQFILDIGLEYVTIKNIQLIMNTINQNIKIK